MCRLGLKRCLAFIGGLGVATSLFASSIVQHLDRMELDWGAMKIRFYGTYAPGSEPDISYSMSEQRAMNEGLGYAREAILKLHKDVLQKSGVSSELAEKSAQQAGEYLTRATYPFQTAFFNKGAVRIDLESGLPKLFVSRELTLSASKQQKEGSLGRFSGLIFRLDKEMKPVPVYTVVDQSGELLLSMASVTREGFEKNLMGRWFVEPQREELVKYVGAKPVSIQAKVLGDEILMVQRGAWTDALQDSSQLLSEGRIALVVPKHP